MSDQTTRPHAYVARVEELEPATDSATVDEMLNRLNAYKETKRQLDEAQNQLSQVYRWIERNQADGFIDSLTYLQNLKRVADNWYDRIFSIENHSKRFLKERDEAREQNAKLRDIAERAVAGLESKYKLHSGEDIQLRIRDELNQLKEGVK